MTELSVLNHENLSNTVYATLCDALISGKFKPGDRIKIRDLAERLGTSVTPVRDAIIRLSHDHAVTFQTARNIQIPLLTEAAYLEIRSIRVRLEALAAETAAAIAGKQDIARLEGLLAENEEAISRGDGARGAELNQMFHFQLAKIANLPTLNGILRGLWLQTGPAIAEIYMQGGREMVSHHYEVVEALKRGDGASAARAIAEDIIEGGRPILDRLRLPLRG